MTEPPDVANAFDFANRIEAKLYSQDPLRLSPEKETITENKKLDERFGELCLEDYKSRLKSRKNHGRTITFLLIGQNIALYLLIGFLVWKHIEQLSSIQWLLSVLVSGTLVETYFVFNRVIQWLFNEVDYKSFVYPDIHSKK